MSRASTARPFRPEAWKRRCVPQRSLSISQPRGPARMPLLHASAGVDAHLNFACEVTCDARTIIPGRNAGGFTLVPGDSPLCLAHPTAKTQAPAPGRALGLGRGDAPAGAL